MCPKCDDLSNGICFTESIFKAAVAALSCTASSSIVYGNRPRRRMDETF